MSKDEQKVNLVNGLHIMSAIQKSIDSYNDQQINLCKVMVELTDVLSAFIDELNDDMDEIQQEEINPWQK